MITLTNKIIEFVICFPKLTATELSHKMHERKRLASISGILCRLVKQHKLYRKEICGVWHYDTISFE